MPGLAKTGQYALFRRVDGEVEGDAACNSEPIRTRSVVGRGWICELEGAVGGHSDASNLSPGLEILRRLHIVSAARLTHAAQYSLFRRVNLELEIDADCNIQRTGVGGARAVIDN